MVTFCPGESTWTPADTTRMPGVSPPAMTAALPSAVAICTGWERTVMVASSSTHTAVASPSLRKALVGSLMAGVPARRIGPVGKALAEGEIERIARNYRLYASWYVDGTGS